MPLADELRRSLTRRALFRRGARGTDGVIRVGDVELCFAGRTVECAGDPVDLTAKEFQILHVASTAGASVLAIGYLVLFVCLIASVINGKKAGPNPWTAKGLEWEIESPPSPHNFHETPIVTKEAYAYEEEDVLLAPPSGKPPAETVTT